MCKKLQKDLGSIAVHPKPIVVGGGVFGEDERQSTWLLMSCLLIGHHRNGDAFEDYFFLTLIYLSIIKFFSGQEEMRS